jgi:hypothetical protein
MGLICSKFQSKKSTYIRSPVRALRKLSFIFKYPEEVEEGRAAVDEAVWNTEGHHGALHYDEVLGRFVHIMKGGVAKVW